MKRILILFTTIFIYQNDGKSQTCGYLLLTNNAEVEMSMFDKKSEPSGKVVYKVLSSNGKEAKVSSKVYNEKGKELAVQQAIQYFFSEQWCSLREYCKERDIRILGDVAIFVNYDSADVWTHPDLFELVESVRLGN